MPPAPLTSPLLSGRGLAHAFFTRAGGVSEGVYASLNGGIGSRDAPAAVRENRRRMAAVLGVAADSLVIPYQVHSPDALVIEAPFAETERPRCDALVTRRKGIALGVTGADCGIVLFADGEAGVVGAAHAGWRGALGGVLEATVDAMVASGARRGAITAVLGPTIGRASYEVGPDFIARFREAGVPMERFFEPARDDHARFDLPAFIGWRLAGAGIGTFEDLALDTYADEDRFFSFRRTTHRKEPDYGRLVAAIALLD